MLVYVGHNLARRVVGLGLRGEIQDHLLIIGRDLFKLALRVDGLVPVEELRGHGHLHFLGDADHSDPKIEEKGLLHLWGKASFFQVFGEKSREKLLDPLQISGFYEAREFGLHRGRIVVNLRLACNIGIKTDRIGRRSHGNLFHGGDGLRVGEGDIHGICVKISAGNPDLSGKLVEGVIEGRLKALF